MNGVLRRHTHVSGYAVGLMKPGLLLKIYKVCQCLFNRKTKRSFKPGDQVLACVPHVSVGVITTTSDCSSCTINKNLGSSGSTSDDVEEGVKGPSYLLLEKKMSHMTTQERVDIFELINSLPSLFPDVPTRTSVIYHEIDVGIVPPIKQCTYHVNSRKREIGKEVGSL